MTAQERTEAARQAILAAACEMIAEAGLENVRMRMVAERAGVSTALLHYHFANRDTLFLAALKYSYANTGSAQLAGDPPADAPHAWTLAQMIEVCLPVTDELRRDFLLWGELTLRATRHAESATAAVGLYRELAEWIAEGVRAGIAAGEFRPVSAQHTPEVVALHVVALTQGYGSLLLLGDGVLTVDAARSAIWTAVAGVLDVHSPMPRAAEPVATV